MVTQQIQMNGVEGYDDIALYRDHENPNVFYYINSQPRISIDKRVNKPIFDFSLIGRGIKRENTEEVQQGRLVMSVDLALTADEMKAVKNTVKKYKESADFKESLKFYSNYKTLLEDENKSKLDMLVSGDPVIKPVDFTSGKTTINIPSIDNKEFGNYEVQPNLFGDCNATFAINVDAQDAQVIHEILMGKADNIDTSIQVKYELKYDAVVPFDANVTVHYKRIYEVVRNLFNEHCGTDAKYTGTWVLPDAMKDINPSGRFYSNGVNLYVSKEGLNNFLRDTNTITNNIEIKINNYSHDDINEKYENLLLESLSKQTTEVICDKMFSKVTPIDPNTFENPNDVKIGETERTTSEHTAGDDSTKDTTERRRKLNYDLSYKFDNDSKMEFTSDYSMTINKNKAFEFTKAPQIILGALMKGYNIDSLVRYIDASNMYFQNIKIPICVEQSNFDGDISAILVRVIYKDKDNVTKFDKVFTFNKESPNPQLFEVLMSHDDKGQLIKRYYYQTQISYKDYNVYDDKQREEDKWSELKERQNDQPIIISNIDAGNLRIDCKASDVAWSEIEKLIVYLKYKDAPDRLGANKQIILTQDNPSGTWNCYMYKGNGNFTYRIQYFYRDGTDDWSEELERIGSKESELPINDKLSGVFKAHFDILFQKSIEKVRVIVKCQGKEENSGWLTEPSTWVWSARMKEDSEKTFQYKYQYYLVNGDESIKNSEWTAPISTEGITDVYETINLSMENISLIIDGDNLDWKKWSRVYVHVKYDDDLNNLHYTDEDGSLPMIRLIPSDSSKNIIIPVINKAVKARIKLEYIPLVIGEDMAPSDEVEVNPGLILLPFAAPPLHDVATAAPEPTPAPEPAAPQDHQSPEPEPEPEPVEKDQDFTFNASAMNWEKWNGVWISFKYDDDENGIHYNEGNIPPFKLSKENGEEKTITIKIKNPEIMPRIKATYISPDGGTDSDETPVTSQTIVLPDTVPPKE